MNEYWLITLQYHGNGENNFATIAIDEAPVEWLIKYGNHRKNTEKNIVCAQQITEDQYKRFDALRS
jgi:hypothetical protein